jgi:hypothetical protein
MGLVAVMVIFAIIIGLILVLLPLFLTLINFVNQYSLQGIVDYVTGLPDKIWNGAVK